MTHTVYYEDTTENGEEFVYEKEFGTRREAIVHAMVVTPMLVKEHFNVGDEIWVDNGLVVECADGTFEYLMDNRRYRIAPDGKLTRLKYFEE